MTQERTIDKVVRELNQLPQGLPSPQVENLRKADKDQLADEFVTLRMFVGNLYMWCRDVIANYKVLHGRLDDMQHELQTLHARLDVLENPQLQETQE